MFTTYKIWKIKPEGWLRRQLEIQAASLSGHLDKIWPDISHSAWIGGDKDGWERVPYWLDGFVPLAFLLEDADLIKRADRYIFAILDGQEESGWICPCTPEKRKDYDLWSLMLISKVLTLYCQFTDSPRAKDALYRAMKNYYELLKQERVGLGLWGEYRWFEALIALVYLQENYQENWIGDLAGLLRDKGVDYGEFRHLWKETKDAWTLSAHIVNLAMMFKCEALTARLLGQPYENKAEEYWQLLDQYHGTAVGCFTGDECLSGINNNRGFELCSVVELMYSCEVLYELTVDPVWMERLEKIAFNALPAAFTEDMWAHQYDQQVNQIGCVRSETSFFRSNNGEANLFGLEPNFGCCTANFSQGWPKLALSSFMKSDAGIVCPILLPAALETEINGVPVKVQVRSDYPFRMEATFVVTVQKPVEFELKIRIPRWARNLKVNGMPVTEEAYYTLNRQWKEQEQLHLQFSAIPALMPRPNGLAALEYGALVFALPIAAEYRMYEYKRDGVVRKFPYCDYELYPEEQWRYGFAQDVFRVMEREFESPFSPSKPPVTIMANLSRVDWDTAEGYPYIAREVPNSHAALSGEEEKELIPYGCAKLRLTEMPVCKPHK